MVFVTFLVTLVGITFASSVVQECYNNENDETVPGYAGWPYGINCYITDDIYDYDYSELDELKCVISKKDTGHVSFNKTVTVEEFFDHTNYLGTFINEIRENYTYNYQVHLNVTLAEGELQSYSKQISIVGIPFSEQTCEEYIATSPTQSPIVYIDSPKQFNFPAELCPALEVDDNIHNVTRIWMRNCSQLPANVQIRNNALVIPSANFDTAGIYTSAVTYNGMTRFVTIESVCVQNPPSTNQHSITCTQSELYASVGDNIAMHCKVRLGTGHFTRLDYKVYWQKNSSMEGMVVFECLLLNEVQRNNQSKEICILEPPSSPCYLYTPSPEQQKPREAIVNVFLDLGQITSNAFGPYVFTATTNLEPSTDDSATIYLRMDVETNTAIIVGSVLGIFGFCCLLILVVILNRLVLTVFWKRYFKAYGDENDKKYGAYIDYHYSIDIDMFAGEEIKHFVNLTRKELVGLGFRVYDDHKDGDQGMRAMRLEENMALCHRIVIILNSQYVKDDWNTYNFQKAFQQMIHSKIRLIFIILPGVKPYIKKQAAKNDIATSGNCLVLREAIRLNYAIHCQDRKKFDRRQFQLQLEYAMPKLKSATDIRKSEIGRHSMTCNEMNVNSISNNEVHENVV
ncbi:unnamed protein product [Clavelina lepadiformis]|uniref:TIR domain-containing protein n=1 Tax=Clavelina lepadiformis TaxID=159417 RepID=A0ABP0FWA3_CLALP